MKVTIRDSGCFTELKEGLWQKIGQTSDKHAALMTMLNKATLSAHGFLLLNVEDSCLKVVWEEIERVCQLFWDFPELIAVLQQNREGRNPKKKIEPYPLNLNEAKKAGHKLFPNVQSSLSYLIEPKDYEVYCALFTRTGDFKEPIDWFPVWIAACICEFENKINAELNNDTDLVELEAIQHQVIAKLCAPLGELLDFELREINRVGKLISKAQKGGETSKKRSVMTSALDSLKDDKDTLNFLKSASSKPRSLAERLQAKGIVTNFEEGKEGVIEFCYLGRSDEFSWPSYCNKVSQYFGKNSQS